MIGAPPKRKALNTKSLQKNSLNEESPNKRSLDRERPDPNTPALLRRRLAQRDGRDVSKLDLAHVLGVSRSHVADLEKRPESRVPPAVRLACSFIARVGFERAEYYDDPTPADIEALLAFIFLPRVQVATLLGISRQGFYELYSQKAGTRDVKPFYHFALLEVRKRFGVKPARLQELHRLLDEGLAYRDG
jgi:predicted DNA-binding transcriptional regulator AlpA